MSQNSEYIDERVEKYLTSQNYDVSNCCGEYVLPDTDICSKCNEHCDTIPIGDYNYADYKKRKSNKEEV